MEDAGDVSSALSRSPCMGFSGFRGKKARMEMKAKKTKT
jgi:hypothetical protein